ncbi:MAG: hypothetical protein HYY17_14855 [Planctomycetes bacterium]|nr:hypothetical protein [Planctomycetota bacterium]
MRYTAEYHYDPAGNRTKKIVNGSGVTLYAYNALNQLTGEQTSGQEPIAYGYDANGNQTSRTQGQGPTAKVETFGYDFAYRISSYTRAVGGVPEAAWLYRTAASGERLAKIDALASTMETEWYMSDGADVCADYAQTGDGPLVPKAAYVQGLGIDSKLARLTLDAAGLVIDTNWFAPDALGSVHQILGSDGALLSMDLTTAWGERLPASTFSFPSATNSRYGYTQREDDSESGLMHFRARSYDPRWGGSGRLSRRYASARLNTTAMS